MPGRSFGRMRLGQRLLELRSRAGVSRGAALTAIDKADLHPDTLRKVEEGDRLFTRFETTSLARYYGAADAEVDEVRDLWNRASGPSEFASFGLPETMVTYLDLERSATTIRTCHNSIIPGLLQIPSYSRRLFELGGVEAVGIEQRIQARLTRQERLRPSDDNRDPVQLIAVFGEEAVLRAEAAQLNALIEFAKLPNIEIRVMGLNAGLHAGALGDFTLLEFPPQTVDDLVYLETASAGQANDAPRMVSSLRRRFDGLLCGGQALGRNESLALISRQLNHLDPHERC